MRKVNVAMTDNEDEVQNSIHSSSIHSVSNIRDEFSPPIRSMSSVDLTELLTQRIHSVRRRYSYDCYDPLETIDRFDSPSTSASVGNDNLYDASAADHRIIRDIQDVSEAAAQDYSSHSSFGQTSNMNGFTQLQVMNSDPNQQEFHLLAAAIIISKIESVSHELFLTGSMPNYQQYLRRHSFSSEKNSRTDHRVFFRLLFFCDIILRGIAQVFLCNHPFSGAFICLGLLLSSWLLLGYAILGTTFGTLGAYLVGGVSIDAISNGLCGYNGALVGSACYIFLGDRSNALLFLIAAVLSFISGYVHICCEHALKVFELPAFTLAFNLTMMCFLLSISTNNVSKFSLAESVPVDYPINNDKMSPSFLLDACTRGVGQFMFVDTTTGSILVIIGIAVASRIAAAAAVSGAFIACIISYYVLSVPDLIGVRHGLFGYNAAGTCAAISGAVFFRAGYRNFAVGCVGAATSVLLLTAFKSIFGYIWHLPILTFPFIFTAWIMMLTRSEYIRPILTGDPVQVDFVTINWRNLLRVSAAATRLVSICYVGVTDRFACRGRVDEESVVTTGENDSRLDEKLHGDSSSKYR